MTATKKRLSTLEVERIEQIRDIVDKVLYDYKTFIDVHEGKEEPHFIIIIQHHNGNSCASIAAVEFDLLRVALSKIDISCELITECDDKGSIQLWLSEGVNKRRFMSNYMKENKGKKK